jgi:hypothetical protein
VYECPLKSSRLTLFLRVGTLWRCGDGPFFEVPPLASGALLTTLHSLLENALQSFNNLEISCIGAPFSLLEKPRNRMWRDLDCMADVVMGSHRSTFFKPNTIQFISRPMRFLGFQPWKVSSNERNFEVITVCRMFSRSGWSSARRASFAKGGTSKKRPSPHLHKVSTRSNKMSPRNFQTALVYLFALT